MKKLTKMQQSLEDIKALSSSNIDLNLKLSNAVRDLEIQKKRTGRKEKVLKDIVELHDGLVFSSTTHNKVVLNTLISQLRKFALSEITFIDEDIEKSKQ